MDQLACQYGPCGYPHACDKTDYARVANNMRAFTSSQPTEYIARYQEYRHQ